MLSVVKHCNWLTRKAVKSSCLEVFKEACGCGTNGQGDAGPTITEPGDLEGLLQPR